MDILVKSQNQSQRKSAKWDDLAQLRFVESCERELSKGNRGGTSFTQYGWNNIVRRFNRMTGRCYSREQLRNHWDAMKRECSLYEDLMQGQPEIGWDPVGNTIVADQEWWNERIKANKLFKKFKGKDLSLLKFKYAPLFSSIGVTGWMGRTPLQLSGHGRDGSVDLDKNMEIDLLSNESSSGCDEALSGNDSMPTVLFDGSGSGLKERKLALKVDPISMVNLDIEESPIHSAPSIRDCIQILYSMGGIEEASQLYGYALNSFKDPVNRVIFASSPTVSGRLSWLKYNFELSGGKL